MKTTSNQSKRNVVKTADKCVTENFLAHLIHDLKTPVVGIGGFAKRLMAGKLGSLNEKQQDAVDNILHNCKRLEHDLNQILEYYTSIEKADQLKIESFDLRVLLKRCMKNFEPEAKERKISLNMNLPVKPMKIEADRQMVGKAVSNLVDNALKHTESGGSVTLGLELIKDNVAIKVADTGKGLDKQTIDEIFSPFEQVIGIKDREIRGFGLGLSNVRRYADLHRGDILVESEPGKGSCFTLRLPQQHRHTT